MNRKSTILWRLAVLGLFASLIPLGIYTLDKYYHVDSDQMLDVSVSIRTMSHVTVDKFGDSVWETNNGSGFLVSTRNCEVWTNHHVIAKTKGGAMGICDREGNAWPVTEIVAANPATDLALFRVGGSGFSPLPLGEPAAIGDEVRVISHPNGRHYIQTFGEVSRYHSRRVQKQEVVMMSITADFAKG